MLMLLSPLVGGHGSNNLDHIETSKNKGDKVGGGGGGKASEKPKPML